MLNAPAAVDILSSTPYRSWHQYIIFCKKKLTTAPVTAWHDDKKTGLRACIKTPEVLKNRIVCEANNNLIFKYRRGIYPDMTLLVYKKSYSFTIGVTILKKVN